MSIYEDAFKGVLYDVGGYTVTQLNDIGTISDDNGEPLKVTPLAAACYGGQPNVVKLLLDNGALPDKDVDKQTPFSFTISRPSGVSSKTQSTIIVELLKGKANINLVCDEMGNTPLMAAIMYSPHDRIVRELVANGAVIDKATKDLARQTGRENLLDKESDTGAMSKQQVVDLVVGLVQVVIAYANDLTAIDVLGGVVKQVYDMSGIKKSDIIKVIPKPPTIDQLTSSVADYAKQKNLSAFFPKEDNRFFEELAKRAVALSKDPSTDLGKPENIGRLTVLSLYEPVLYLDDSGSMKRTDPGKSQTRFQLLGELVRRIASIATKIVPDELAGVELRFINSAYADRHDAEGIDKAVKRIYPRGSTQIGIKLREKVLKPIVYDVVAKKSPANPIPLKRPVLVCIITDGAPENEDARELQDEILRCRDILRVAGYEDDAVMFCVSQIGQAEEAVQFMNDLQSDARLGPTTHCSSDRLDDMFQDLNSNEKGLEVWLLKLLTRTFFQRDAE